MDAHEARKIATQRSVLNNQEYLNIKRLIRAKVEDGKFELSISQSSVSMDIANQLTSESYKVRYTNGFCKISW